MCPANYLKSTTLCIQILSLFIGELALASWTVSDLTGYHDQDIISPYNLYNIKQTSVENNAKKSIRGLLVDPILNYLNQHQRNCMIDSKESC